MQTVLVAGLGEVGKAIKSLIEKSGRFRVEGLDLLTKPECGIADYLHICFPHSQQFNKRVLEYIWQFSPKLTIIHSTVPPKTTTKIMETARCKIAYSPVRGVHKSDSHFQRELKRYTKYVSSTEGAKHLKECGFKTAVASDSVSLELAKLWETTYYGLMIAASQEMQRVSEWIGADYQTVLNFIADTHRERGDRPPMTPGFIGGHCVIPNTRILNEAYPSNLFAFILESNMKKQAETNPCQSLTAPCTIQS